MRGFAGELSLLTDPGSPRLAIYATGRTILFQLDNAHLANPSLIFTALHGTQTRSYDEISVRLFVRLSVKREDCEKNGRKICLYFYTIRNIIYRSFLRRRMVSGGDPSTLNFGSNSRR